MPGYGLSLNGPAVSKAVPHYQRPSLSQTQFEAWLAVVGDGKSLDYDSAAKYQRAHPGRLRVDLDVFSTIISYLGQAELSILMQTCKALYAMGLPSICAKYHDRHRSPLKTLQFLRYMLAVPDDRIPHLRLLELNKRPGSSVFHNSFEEAEEAGALLAELLSRAGSLQTLCLWECDVWLATVPRIATAAATFASLRVLKLGVGGRTIDFIQQIIGAPLQSVTLALPKNLAERRFDAAQYFQYHRVSLVEIELPSYDLFAPHDEPSLDLVWPHVRKLTHGSAKSLTRAAHFKQFPSLEDLSFTGASYASWREVEQAHILNDRLRGCWSRLDRIHADVGTLYSLAISCPIREINIFEWAPVGPEDLSPLCVALQRARPVVLALNLSQKLDDGMLARLWSTLPELRCLVLCYAHFKNHRSPECADRLPATLSLLRITHLHLDLDWWREPILKSEAARMEELANMEEELVVYLQDIASRVPSLKFVFCGYPRSATYLSSWEIRETAHGSTIALLEETAALRLIETSWKLTESGSASD